MKLSTLSLRELEDWHGRHLAAIDRRIAAARRVWAEIQRRKTVDSGEVSIERNEDAMPDFSIFKETTCRLLEAMWAAPDKMLSQHDIREDVIFDEEASENAVKQVIKKAKKEIKGYAINIKNIYGKGYQLVLE